MKAHLLFHRGQWYCGPQSQRGRDFRLWACVAPTVRKVCELWVRCL